MGFSFALDQNKSQLIMKVLLLVALAIAAVVAEPEAEAKAGAPLPYFGPPYQPNYYANPKKLVAHPAVPVYGYYGHPYHFGHYLGKRSAEAEPTANADALTYGGRRFVYFGQPYQPNYYANYATHPYYHYGHYLGKRSADAEPTAEADPAVVYQGVTGVYGVGLPGHLGNLGHYGQFGAGHLGHVGHLGYTIAKPTPVSAEAAEDAKVSPTVLKPAVYGHPGLYHNPLVALPHTVKPVAAVPSTVGHLGYPYAGVLGLGASHYVVKREAEAAPEAAPEADAYYGYGGYRGYGYGLPSGYAHFGGYGYGYGHGYGYGYYG